MQLQTSASGAFLSDGKGGTVVTLSLGPQRYSERWSVTRASISTSGTATTVCRVYLNMVNPSAYIDGTSKANQNVSDLGIELQSLDKLLFVFTGGEIGTYATVVLAGQQEYGA